MTDDPNEHFAAMPVTVPLFVRLVVGLGIVALVVCAALLAFIVWALHS